MTADLEALAEKIESHVMDKFPTNKEKWWDRGEIVELLLHATALGYSIAGPDEMVTPKKSIAPIEEAFKDFDIAGPDEVLVPRDVLEDLLAFYEIEDEAHVPGSDAWITKHRADLALNPETMSAATAPTGGKDG